MRGVQGVRPEVGCPGACAEGIAEVPDNELTGRECRVDCAAMEA